MTPPMTPVALSSVGLPHMGSFKPTLDDSPDPFGLFTSPRVKAVIHGDGANDSEFIGAESGDSNDYALGGGGGGGGGGAGASPIVVPSPGLLFFNISFRGTNPVPAPGLFASISEMRFSSSVGGSTSLSSGGGGGAGAGSGAGAGADLFVSPHRIRDKNK